MDKFIYNETKEKWEDYLINIKKILSQPNNITTNDTFLEDKNDMNDVSIIKEKNNSFNLGSFDENEDDLFSFNYNESLLFFVHY